MILINDNLKMSEYDDLCEYFKERYMPLMPVTSPECLKRIHDLFIKNMQPIDDYNDADYFLYVGIYYSIKGNIDNMLKYYKMSAEFGNSDAINKLGDHFYYRGNYDEMLKYFLMTVDLRKNKECCDNALKNQKQKRIHIIANVINSVFKKLNNEQLEKLLDYRHILYEDNLKILEKKIEDGEINECMIKCAHKLY